MVSVLNENAIRIQEYIRDRENKQNSCKTDYSVSIELDGKSQAYPAYLLPIDLLLFNKENGRLASSIERHENESGLIDPKSEEGKKHLMTMLLKLDTKKTEEMQEDFRSVGQREPGIITFDGVVLNGNRRMAVLLSLAGEKNSFNYFLTAILPDTVKPKDLFRIEASLQYAKDFKMEYSSIDQLLTIRKGLGIFDNKKKELAKTLGMTTDEIDKKFAIIKAMEVYLDQIGKPGTEHMYLLKEKYSHFDEIEKLKKAALRNLSDKSKITTFLDVACKMVKTGSSHREIRDLNLVLKSDSETLYNNLKKADRLIDLKDNSEFPEKITTEFNEIIDQSVMDAKQIAKSQEAGYHLSQAKRHIDSVVQENSDLSKNEIILGLRLLITTAQKKIRELGEKT